MTRQQPLRQRIRQGILLLAFLTFPLTINYFSPYLIVDGAAQGILSGSAVLFGLMFLSALFLGRAWCGWLCPGGAFQDLVEPINRRLVNRPKLDWIKWLIWVPWISLIVWLFGRAGGLSRLNFFYLTESGISVDEPAKYIVYYVVLLLFGGLAIAVGRRAGCHTICWMAPFMILGRAIRNRFGWASLQLAADAAACTNCKVCSKSCPMSLDVNAMVQLEQMENAECILCGECVDHCAKGAIRYQFGAARSPAKLPN
jgi:polyferredoxin